MLNSLINGREFRDCAHRARGISVGPESPAFPIFQPDVRPVTHGCSKASTAAAVSRQPAGGAETVRAEPGEDDVVKQLDA
jgi:hypothetical protein